jgi:hypothetical protein
VTDSTCDLPQSVVAEYGITVLPMYINIGSRGYLDGVELTREEFYERLPEFDPLPTTGTPGPGAFRRAYESLAALSERGSAVRRHHAGDWLAYWSRRGGFCLHLCADAIARFQESVSSSRPGSGSGS